MGLGASQAGPAPVTVAVLCPFTQVGKRRGGNKLALKTGIVAKKQKTEDEVRGATPGEWGVQLGKADILTLKPQTFGGRGGEGRLAGVTLGLGQYPGWGTALTCSLFPHPSLPVPVPVPLPLPLPRPQVLTSKGDAWAKYMAEVKKYKAHQCGDDDKTRPLVK